MKALFTAFLFSLCTLCLAGCGGDSDDDATPTNANITLSATAVDVGSEGGTSTVAVSVDREWMAYASADWLTVSPTSSTDRQATLTITVNKNTTYTARTAQVTVKAGTTRATITVTQQAAQKEETDPTIVAPDGYTLVWNDEFDGTSLNTTKWTYEIWNAGQVNNELQAYVKSDGVATVADGALSITCKKVDGKVVSARLYANYKTGWKYGYFEARIKLPKGRGTWPAFWMMPVNFDNNSNPWPGCGEIDIMEEVGYNPNYVSSTIHCNKYNNTGTATEHTERYLAGAEGDFHVYACEWTAYYLRFYVDGELTLTYSNDGTGKDAWPFDNPFYIILNLAWGGDWGGQQGVDESALPATMQVDYVRVFQQQ